MTYSDRWRSDRDWRRDEDSWSGPSRGGQGWRGADADFARSEGFEQGGRWSGGRHEGHHHHRHTHDHDHEHDHDRGYEPFGGSGRTYYGEGGGYDRDGASRYAGYGQRHYRPNETDRGGSLNESSQYGVDYGYGRTFGGGADRDYGADFRRSRDRGGRQEWSANPRGGVGGEGRSWWDKTTDEVQSWFGDDDAERRRRWDEVRAGEHRGRGPKNYRRSDERIREDVSDRLTDDAWLDASNIEVSVKDGDITLAGTVQNRRDKRRAEDLAESCSGVGNVQNNLRVQSGQGYGDSSQNSLDLEANPKVNAATSGRA